MTKKNSPGLYLHVPFCKKKCPYCDFYSVSSPALISSFLSSLEKEVALRKDEFKPFDSLYLGGGTPTILNDGQLASLVDYLNIYISFGSDPEITIEANPENLSRQKARLLLDLGFNRLSIGIQSFDDQELRFLRRNHSAREAKGAIVNARNAGFNNLNIDFIYGIPGQTLSQWLQILEEGISYHPEHISCYQLTIKENTPFGRLKKKGGIVPKNEKEEQSFFFKTSEFLETRGYIHYEISSFAREERFFSRHNQKYWQHLPYLGLGPSAHSFSGNSRWWNVSSVKEYCAVLTRGLPPVKERETLSQEQLGLEALFLGLRTKKGVNLEKLRRQYQWDLTGNNDKPLLSKLESNGFLKIEESCLRPTRKGFMLSDSLLLYLFSPNS